MGAIVLHKVFSTKRVNPLRKILILFLVIFAFQALISIEFVIAKQNSFSVNRRDKLFAVHFIDKETGFVVGNNGLLLHTIDGGENWETVEVNSIDALNDITFIGKQGWIVGGRGLILQTNDGGQRWTKQKSNSSNSLMAVHFINQSEGFAVGEEGTILITEEGGASWQTYPLDWMSILPQDLIAMGVLAPSLYDIFFIDNVHGWIVGEKGVVLYTSDGGKQWELLSTGIYFSLYSVLFKNEFEGFVAGQDGTLLHSEDGGKSWDQLKVPIEINKMSFFKIALEGSLGVVVGDRGVVLKSLDRGKTWDKVAIEMSPPLPWFLGVSIIPRNSPNEVLLVGQGVIRKFLVH